MKITIGTMMHRKKIIMTMAKRMTPAVATDADEAVDEEEIVDEVQGEAIRMVGSLHKMTRSRSRRPEDQVQLHHN